MKTFLVVGHSHIYALMRAHQGVGRDWSNGRADCRFVELLAPEFQPVRVRGRGRGKQLNPALLDALANGGPYDGLLSCIGGNNHNLIGLLDPPVAYDFVLPEQPDLPLRPGAMVVPVALVRARLARSMANILSELKLVRDALGDVPAYHLESPPVIPSEDHIRQHPSYFSKALKKRQVAPASLRYKLWRLQSAKLAEACAANDILFTPVPRTTQDGDGMMRPEYWNPDPSHGNEAYGAVVLKSFYDNYVTQGTPDDSPL